MTVKQRFEPLITLLDTRYFPLLFAAAPQAYTVYKWLYQGDRTDSGWAFAVIGALGFEMVYVGAIAWAEQRTQSRWFWITALTALAFSVAVAVHLYYPFEDLWSILHGGFPLVAFSFTMLIHRGQEPAREQLDYSQAIYDLENALGIARSNEQRWYQYAMQRDALLKELQDRPVIQATTGAADSGGDNQMQEEARELVASAVIPQKEPDTGLVARVVTLRNNGATWKEVAQQLGLNSEGAARHYYKKGVQG